MAGEAAARLNANTEAAGHYGHALQAAREPNDRQAEAKLLPNLKAIETNL